MYNTITCRRQRYFSCLSSRTGRIYRRKMLIEAYKSVEKGGGGVYTRPSMPVRIHVIIIYMI